MSRHDDDIPEVFRRAMEEAGWRENQGDDGPQGPPRSANPPRPWWTNRWLWILLLALVLLVSFNWIITTYTDWLWFTEVGFESVWLKQWGVQIITFAVFFVIAAAVLLLNWHQARRHAIRPAGGVQVLNLPGVGALITGAALFLAFILGEAASSQWESLLRYFYQVPFGIADPIFSRDLSFYLFDLPVLHLLQGWLMPLFVVTIIGTVVVYLANHLPSIQNRRLEIRTLPASMRRHVSVLLGLFFLTWAAGYYLDIYDLLFSPRGVVFGAGYTDLRASLPALWGQLITMVLVAAGIVFYGYRANPRPVFVAVGLWAIVAFGVNGLYAGLLQRYAVEPNELARETPYIEHNIALTRLGFGLQDVSASAFRPDNQLTSVDVAENENAIENIRLWDYRPLQQTYAQLQELRPYYQFTDVDIDRYELDGQTRQVMLAARELNKAGLTNPTWVNQKLEFTHGYGIVMNPVDRVTPQGRPEFYIKDLPPQSSVDIEVTRPEIYYGERTNDVVYAASQLDEFDYPQGNENVYSSYEGDGGVPIANTFRRLLFALRFGEPNLILSEYVDNNTRVLFYRRIQERVNRVAPFLWQDHDPYVVVVDGKLMWIMDTYTVSNNFPYSEPSTVGTSTVPPGINYIRNAVKVTIDAYTGELHFYVADPDDPIIQTYANAFPDLFEPMDAMPASLYQHIRYPEDLFLIQTNKYLTYHMQDVQVFYNKEDLWQIPQEVFMGNQQPMEPYYVTFSLPGEEDTEYLLIQPYTPAGKSNMIAWIAARNDPPNYGELAVYELPKQELVFGPLQVEGRIDQEPTISEQFSLWNQLGSQVIRGNLIVVPINDSFLYVEPVYLQSDTSALPELKRVVLVSGDEIVMRTTLDEALAALLERAPAVDEIVVEPEGTPTAGEGQATPAATPPAANVNVTVEELILSANDHFLAAETAQRNGDWTTYGAELDALQQDLQRLLELSGGEGATLPTVVPTPAP